MAKTLLPAMPGPPTESPFSAGYDPSRLTDDQLNELNLEYARRSGLNLPFFKRTSKDTRRLANQWMPRQGGQSRIL